MVSEGISLMSVSDSTTSSTTDETVIIRTTYYYWERVEKRTGHSKHLEQTPPCSAVYVQVTIHFSAGNTDLKHCYDRNQIVCREGLETMHKEEFKPVSGEKKSIQIWTHFGVTGDNKGKKQLSWDERVLLNSHAVKLQLFFMVCPCSRRVF